MVLMMAMITIMQRRRRIHEDNSHRHHNYHNNKPKEKTHHRSYPNVWNIESTLTRLDPVQWCHQTAWQWWKVLCLGRWGRNDTLRKDCGAYMNTPPFPSCWSIRGISSACPEPSWLKIAKVHVIILLHVIMSTISYLGSYTQHTINLIS